MERSLVGSGGRPAATVRGRLSAPVPAAFPEAAERVQRLDECIQWLVCRFYVRRFSEGSLRDLGTAEAFVLAALGRLARARMTDVARATGIPLSTLTGVVDRLVARRYARRAHGVEDRRQVLVTLTVCGRRAYQEYLDIRTETCAAMLAALGEEEGDRLVGSLAQIRRALGE